MITKKEVLTILMYGGSHNTPGLESLDLPKGITRFQAFLAIKWILKERLYWYALSEAYQMSDNLYEYRHDVKMAFQSDEPGREYLMNKKERDFIQTLPEEITIYRGMTDQEFDSGNFGISWTLKEETAKFFTDTYIRNYATRHLKKVIHRLTISKSEVIAFFNGRKEFEIIYIHPFKQAWQK